MTSDKRGRTTAGEALFDLAVETMRTFFRLRAAGARMGAVTSWGGGLWGLLHGLKTGGPQTVPQMARARPVARQRIQRLVNDMAEGGLVEFVDNPAHRRSKLVRLTPKGEAVYGELTGRMRGAFEGLARDMDADELHRAEAAVRGLRERLEQA